MKRGYYIIDPTGKANVSIKYVGVYIQSWRHKQVREAGKEVWYFSGKGRWSRSLLPGITKTSTPPKLVQMLELTGSL